MLVVGVMSGTSCDGVDVVLVDFNEHDSHVSHIIAAQTTSYPNDIKDSLLRVIANQASVIADINQLDAQLGVFYADTINDLLLTHGVDPKNVIAVGLHGQTVCHLPPGPNSQWVANTMQLGSAAITAQKTQITTVANFRQMDVAYGGQGAPLAPVLHQHIFAQKDKVVAVLNLGGIANITLLNGSEVFGFDTGPASCLMDAYIQAERDLPFDEAGQWAQQGHVHAALLEDMLNDAYFNLGFPKSTGRELFNLKWLNQHLERHHVRPVDVQRTLLQLTVDSIVQGLILADIEIKQMVVCGGGTHNQLLMQQLQQKLTCQVNSSANWGMNPDYVEAVLMAWLAKQNIKQIKLDLNAITGCQKPHIYGVQYNI